MLSISQRLQETRTPDAFLVLPFELRSRSRLRATLTTGEQAGIVLPRGQVLRGGDLLLASDGRVVRVEAASETVSTVHSGELGLLARAAYHLGNRHVALQAPFEPEAGAYHGGVHDHSHTDHHGH